MAVRGEPMHELVAELRAVGYTVSSVTKELESPVPVMRIETPDGAHRMDVLETDFFADPKGCVSNIRLQLRQLGYMT